MRGRTNISKLAKIKGKSKILQMPNRLGQDKIHRGRFSPYLQAITAKTDRYLQPLSPELVSGSTSTIIPQKALIPETLPPFIGASVIVMH